MGERRKRQRLSEEGDAVVTTPTTEESAPDSNGAPKKARKETNASARRSLFVRSLPATATSAALTELFSQNYPLKHATVVLDPETKQSKGYGFVTFADAEDAQRAKDEFHGKAFQGRKMKVEIAEPRSRDVDPSKAMGGKKKSTLTAEAAATKQNRQTQMEEARKPPKLIIRNLPWSVNTPEKLQELFISFGKVKFSTLPKVKDTQAGFGFVVMRGRKNAEKALAAINGRLVDGRTLAVDWAVEKDVWQSQKSNGSAAAPAVDEVDEDDEEEEDSDGEAPVIQDEDPEDTATDVANFMKNFGDNLESEDGTGDEDDDYNKDDDDFDEDEDEEADAEDDGGSLEDIEEEVDIKVTADRRPKTPHITDNSTTLFVRNLPFTVLDPDLKEHFMQFGPVRYARVVMDRATDRPKGTGFVCFFNVEDADNCFRQAPKYQPTGANATKKNDGSSSQIKHSVLQDDSADIGGLYTIQGRVLQVSKAVEKETAVKLTEAGTTFRDDRDKDKRKLYLLSEGTVAAGTPLYTLLAPSEIKMREDSATQRKKLIQGNPTLHLSLTRLSIRNLPRNINSKDLKALAREAVVGFATDVKTGLRSPLSKEEEARGGDDMRDAEKQRKAKGKGIVRQSKIVFEGREGAKVTEESGAGRSRGYGFIEYSSHRWALMGLRWLNGHALESGSGKKQRLIVEFAIENAQVVQRRKENEEKARVRSKEVVAAREKAISEGKEVVVEKKALGKNALMKKTRKGMAGKPGRPDGKGRGKPGERGGSGSAGRPDGKGRGKPEDRGTNSSTEKPAKGTKKRNDGPEKKSAAGRRPERTKGKPDVPAVDDEKLARKQQIIGRKRQMRKVRKGGA